LKRALVIRLPSSDYTTLRRNCSTSVRSSETTASTACDQLQLLSAQSTIAGSKDADQP
jgi:hypothetical protein